MEMSEGISEDAQTCRGNMSTRDKHEPEDTNKDSRKDSKEAHNLKLLKLYKLAVVFLGLLCVLLWAAIMGLCIKTAELRHQLELTLNKSKEKHQLQTLYNNLIIEKAHLQTSSNNLNREKSLLQTQYGILKNETSQKEAEFNSLAEQMYLIQQESLKQIKSHAVDVTLDPDTAHPEVILSADGKQARVGQRRQDVLKTSKRFWTHTCVFGNKGFFSDKFYYEVQIMGKTAWDIGVARESVNRNDHITLFPEYGYWTISLRNGTEYKANLGPSVSLSLREKPQRVGVFVDYEAGLVSFYDADCWYNLFSFKGATFNETIYPYFYIGGQDSAPVTIHPLVKCMPDA